MLRASAAVLTGLVLGTASAMAHDTQRDLTKPIVTAEKDEAKGPRICLFSQNGKRAETASDTVEQSALPQDMPPASDDTQREAAAPAKVEIAQRQADNHKELKPSDHAAAQPEERVCGTDVDTPVAPHG